MNVLIIEDEGIAADRLERLLLEIDPNIQVLERLDSVRSSVNWLHKNEAPDLAFFDIQLADGKSFDILEQVPLRCPIIFTTAYDQYAVDAFKVNAIDYLLKPIVPEDLKTAIEKFKGRQSPVLPDPNALIALLQQQSKKYKERFVVKVGDHLKSVQTSECLVIYSQEKATWSFTSDKKIFLLDYPLDQIEDMLNPEQFFRISRKFIVNLKAISDIITFSNSRLKLKVEGFKSEEMIVARERVGDFKAWLDR